MKSLTKAILLIFISIPVAGQNLVPNPSFEDYTICPSFVAQISRLTFWKDPLNHRSTADYFNTCSPPASIVSVPTNFAGDQMPATGNGYVGLVLLHYLFNDFREYIQVKLTSPLTAGTVYALSFKYSLSDNSEYATNSFGVYFSALPASGAGPFDTSPIQVTPQVKTTTFLDNKTVWTTITMNYTAVGGEEYILLGNFNNDNNTPVILTPTSGTPFAGSYVYLDDVSVSLAVNPPDVLSLGRDTVLCNGQTLTLNATKPNATYLWQDGSVNATYTVSQPGTYWVHVTTSNGILSDTIQVNYVDMSAVNLGNDPFFCTGDSLFLTMNIPNGTNLWSTGSTDTVLSIKQPGQYWVIVTIGNCTARDTITVTEEQLPVFTLGPDTSVCILNNFLLTPNPVYNNGAYLWSNAGTSANNNINNPGSYWLQFTSSRGCRWADSITVLRRSDCRLFIPDIFTPNNDGKNDVFKIGETATLNDFSMRIYNRWGQRIFESNNIATGWNGFYNQKIQPPGVYIYFITGRNVVTNEVIRLKGTVILAR
jgi:gliding motility-associated-like protein